MARKTELRPETQQSATGNGRYDGGRPRVIGLDAPLLGAPPRTGRFDGPIRFLVEDPNEISSVARYAIAAGFGALAALITLLLAEADVTMGRLSLPVLVIVVGTFMTGIRAGLLSVLVAIVLVEFVVLEPRWRLDWDQEELMGMLAFGAAGMIGGGLSLVLRQSRMRALMLADQRQQLLHAVLENDQHLRNMADAMPVLVARASRDGEIDYYNRSLLEYTGKTREELEDDGWVSIVHPDDAKEAMDRWQQRVQNGVAEVFEQRLRRYDGTYRWHLVFGEPVRDAEGRISYWIGANVDIHDRKVIERELQVSEERWRLMAEGLPALVAEADARGNITYLSPRLTEYAGISSDELRGNTLQIAHPDDVDRARKTYARAVGRGTASLAEWRVRRHDGEYRWHIGFISPIKEQGGAVRSWVGALIDIHDRKVAEEALAASEDRYRTLADSIEAMIGMTTREDGIVDFFNKQFYDYTGLTPDTLPERAMQEVTHPDDFEASLEAWREARAGGRPFVVEERIRSRHGEYRWHLARGTPLPAENGTQPWLVTIVDIHDRKRAEEAIAVSEDRYRTLANSMDAIICMSSRGDGVLDFFNRRFYEYTGIDPDDPPELPIRAALHPDDYPDAVKLYYASRESGQAFTAEHRWRRHDGEYRWHMARGTPVPSSSGDVVQWMLTIVDIHDRMRAEEALRDSEEQYRALSDTIPAMVHTNAADGTFLFANQQYYEYTGFNSEQAKDLDQTLLHPEDVDRVVGPCVDILRRGESAQTEARLRRHDGQYRWHLKSMRPVFDAAGAVTASVTVNLDIHERKIAEERERLLADARSLLAASLDYQDVLENLVRLLVPSFAEWCAIYVQQPDGTIQRAAVAYGDPALRKYAEMPAVVDPDGTVGAANVLRTGKPEVLPVIPEDLYPTVHDESGRSVRMRSNLSVPMTTAGRTLGVLSLSSLTAGRFAESDADFASEFGRQAAVALDQARLYRTLQETADDLRAANATKDEFLGLVSHELKTPITTILGNAEVLHRRGTLLDEDTRASALGDIQNDAARLHQIIENLLILARLERGREIEMEPLLVTRIVEKLVADHRLRYAHRDVNVDAADAKTPVMASEVYLEQVIRNLMSNAEKYSPSHMPIDVHIGAEGDAFVIAVMDRGTGVPAEERDSIFDAFFRSSVAGHIAGVGIGLAVCKRLVEAQGGDIAYTPRDGGGSIFRVTLPLSADELAEA